MSFFALIAALLLERAGMLPARDALLAWFKRYTDRVAHDLDAGEEKHAVAGWLAAVAPWALLGLIGFFALRAISPVLGWLWNVALLYLCIGLREVGQPLRAVSEALRTGDMEGARQLLATWRGGGEVQFEEADLAKAAIETALLRGHQHLFGAIFWFMVLPGPTGAILYRLAGVLREDWGAAGDTASGPFGHVARRAFEVLDWIPARLTAIGFAIAGNFEDAVSSWRQYAAPWLDRTDGIVLASGAGALWVRLGGPMPREGGVDFRPELGEGDAPDADHVLGAYYLLWRTLVVWLVLLLLLTLARWVGS
jgi:cobalamin biosynthesis protein CobD/CbiB